MRLSRDPLKISASFDGPNLVSRTGLAPVKSLAERVGFADETECALSRICRDQPQLA